MEYSAGLVPGFRPGYIPIAAVKPAGDPLAALRLWAVVSAYIAAR
jgi:hypothetical protein